jgi:hypothetical protein
MPLGEAWWLRVWLNDSVHRDQVAAARYAVLQGGVARFGQVPTGTFDLVIDAGIGAPVFRRNVELDAGGGDLGRVAIPRGSHLTLELDVPEGVEKPKTYAFARRLGAVNYGRNSDGAKETPPTIPGLGAGRFDVSLYRESGDLGWRGEVEIDAWTSRCTSPCGERQRLRRGFAQEAGGARTCEREVPALVAVAVEDSDDARSSQPAARDASGFAGTDPAASGAAPPRRSGGRARAGQAGEWSDGARVAGLAARPQPVECVAPRGTPARRRRVERPDRVEPRPPGP